MRLQPRRQRELVLSDHLRRAVATAANSSSLKSTFDMSQICLFEALSPIPAGDEASLPIEDDVPKQRWIEDRCRRLLFEHVPRSIECYGQFLRVDLLGV